MQGPKNSVESLPETLDVDHSTAGMDQENWSNVLHQAETQNLPSYQLSPGHTHVSFVNSSIEDDSSLRIWDLGGPGSLGGPRSAEHSLDQENHDETKMELGWLVSPIDGGLIEADNMLSMEDVDINLTNTQHSFSFSLGSNVNQASQDLDRNANHTADMISEPGSFSHPHVPSLLGHEHGLPPPLRESLSGAVGFMLGDNDDRPGSSVDGRRLACKRKNIEGLAGRSLASGSTNSFHASHSNPALPASVRTNPDSGINISSTSTYTPATISSAEQLNPRFSPVSRGLAQNVYPAGGNRESSQRNFRLRMNPARQHEVYPPNLSSASDNIWNSGIWLPSESSPNHIALNQRLESRLVAGGSRTENQPRIPVSPSLTRHLELYPWNGASGSRNGSSSDSVSSSDPFTAIREDTRSRTLNQNDVAVQPLLVPAREIRNLAQDSENWNSANGNATIGGTSSLTSRPGTSSSPQSSLGSPWTPHHNPPTQISRGLAEAVRRTLHASESRGQNSNLLSQCDSSTSQQVAQQSGRNSQQSRIRQALLRERQSDGDPISISSLAAREGRSRMISEIRNALDLMRRGENLRFEDVFMLDHRVYHGMADMHDRHRDMRLDVDSMSYEELLALEERIGNVSTGINEETILKGLKQWKYFPLGEENRVKTEPCSICQEEYIEGEDLGTLDCGHEFHTDCIKQWLTQKNLCPICKTTALGT